MISVERPSQVLQVSSRDQQELLYLWARRRQEAVHHWQDMVEVLWSRLVASGSERLGRWSAAASTRRLSHTRAHTQHWVSLKPGFHYPSWRPELTARVDEWPVSITRQHGRKPVTRQLGPSTRVVETGLNTDRQTDRQTLRCPTRLCNTSVSCQTSDDNMRPFSVRMIITYRSNRLTVSDKVSRISNFVYRLTYRNDEGGRRGQSKKLF